MYSIYSLLIAVLAGALLGFVFPQLLLGVSKKKKVAVLATKIDDPLVEKEQKVAVLEEKLSCKRRRFPTISKWNTIPTDAANFDGSTVQPLVEVNTKGKAACGTNNNAPDGVSCTALVTPSTTSSDQNACNGVDDISPSDAIDEDNSNVLRLLLVGRTLALYTISEEEEYARRETLARKDMRWLAGKVALTEASDAKRAAAESFAAEKDGEGGSDGVNKSRRRSSTTKRAGRRSSSAAISPSLSGSTKQEARQRHLLPSDVLLGKITIRPSMVVTMVGNGAAHTVKLSCLKENTSKASTNKTSRHIACPPKDGLFDGVPRAANMPKAAGGEAADGGEISASKKRRESNATVKARRTPLTNADIPTWYSITLAFETYREACRWYNALRAAVLSSFSTASAAEETANTTWMEALRAAAILSEREGNDVNAGAPTKTPVVSNPLLGALATRMLTASVTSSAGSGKGYSDALTSAFLNSFNNSARRLEDAPIYITNEANGDLFEDNAVGSEDMLLPIHTDVLIENPSPAPTASSTNNLFADVAPRTSTIGCALKLIEMRACQSNGKAHKTLADVYHLGDLAHPCEKPYDDVSDDDEKGSDAQEERDTTSAPPPIVLYDVACGEGAPRISTATGEVSFDASVSTANSRNPFVECLFQLFAHSEPCNLVDAAEEGAAGDVVDDGNASACSYASSVYDQVRVLPPLYAYVKLECLDGRLRANISAPQNTSPTASGGSGSTSVTTTTPDLWFGFYGRPAATVTCDIIDPTNFRTFYGETMGMSNALIRQSIAAYETIKKGDVSSSSSVYEDAIRTAVAEGVFSALMAEVTLPHYGALPMPTISSVGELDQKRKEVRSARAATAALGGRGGISYLDAKAILDAYAVSRLELHEAQCALLLAEAINGVTGVAGGATIGIPSLSQPPANSSTARPLSLPPASPMVGDRTPTASARSSLRTANTAPPNSNVVPWLNMQQSASLSGEQQQGGASVSPAEVASLSRWSFPKTNPAGIAVAAPRRNSLGRSSSIAGGQSNSSAIMANSSTGGGRATTPLRKLFQRGPSPLLSNEDGSRMNSARSEARFETSCTGSVSAANVAMPLLPLSASTMSTVQSPSPLLENSTVAGAGTSGGSNSNIGLELNGFRKREEQLRAALAEARAQAEQEQARRIAEEEKNDRRREEEVRKSQARLAELELRMREEKERETRRKLQEEIDRQNDDDRARRRLIEKQLEDERKQRNAIEEATASRIANTERAITVLSEAIQKLADRSPAKAKRRQQTAATPSNSDSDANEKEIRSKTRPSIAEEKVSKLQEQVDADKAESAKRKEEEERQQKALEGTIADLQMKLEKEIDQNKKREEEDRRHKEREEELARQIQSMQQKQHELQAAIEAANALGEQVKDRELQLRQTEETLDMLRNHLIGERNEQALMEEQRAAEEEVRLRRAAELEAERERRNREESARIEATQKELEALKARALEKEKEAEERRREEQKEMLRTKEKQRKAQARLKEAEEAIIALQAQIMSGPTTPRSTTSAGNTLRDGSSTPRNAIPNRIPSPSEGSATPVSARSRGGGDRDERPKTRSDSAPRRHGSRIKVSGRDSPRVGRDDAKKSLGGSPPPQKMADSKETIDVDAADDDDDGGDSDFEYKTRAYKKDAEAILLASAKSGPLHLGAAATDAIGGEEPTIEHIQSSLSAVLKARVSRELEVESVEEGSLLQREDMLLEFGGEAIHSLAQLYALVKKGAAAGGAATAVANLSLLRGGMVETVTIALKQ